MKVGVKGPGLLCILCASVVNCFSLDREAFTLTNYDLQVQIDPEQHRLAARGKITLRNDSSVSQKIAVLQISSSLAWRSIKASDKPLQFVSQTYTSDIDHTGALSEAIVTLPAPVAPKGALELDVAYEGVIVRDATRLTRIGAPEAEASSSDWDHISATFAAVRGVGNVAWYPIAADAANLSEENSLFEVIGRWKRREAESTMELRFESPTAPEDAAPPIILCGGTELRGVSRGGSPKLPWSQCSYRPLGLSVPAFVMADYELADRPSICVFYLSAHSAAAAAYADAAAKAAAFITDWFGASRSKAETADLADPDVSPFESGSLLLMPLTTESSNVAGLAAAHQLTHASFSSSRPWIDEGLAHFAQALYLEQEKGRQAALEYMGLHRSRFAEAEKRATPTRSEDQVDRSLVNTTSEELYRSKAMYVWWMLRDMIGDTALKKAIASYRPEQDKEPSYMQSLVAGQSQRDLEWFFDDWVYRDRGLPDFKVESAFPRKTLAGAYLLTITVNNSGAAGAEVPVTVKFAGGEITKRLEVRANSKGVIRVEVPALPQQVIVNDGSVPESDMTNNTLKVEAADK
jgi:hypothetical protein